MKRMREEKLDRIAGAVLLIGSGAAIILMVAGALMLRSDENPLIAKGVQEALHSALQLQATGILNTGVLLLMITPLLRVVTAMTGFFLIRSWRFALVSLVVLGMLGLSIFLASPRN